MPPTARWPAGPSPRPTGPSSSARCTPWSRPATTGGQGPSHITTNVLIEVDAAGTQASARSCFTVLQQVGPEPKVIIAGRYEDTFALRDGAWAFTDRLIHTDLVGDLSNHLRGASL
jgi:hypothetical protein